MLPLLTQDEFNFIKESNEIESEEGIDLDHLAAFMAVKERAVETNKLDEKFILTIHTLLMHRKLRKFFGEYRQTPVAIYQGGRLIKEMPGPNSVPYMMEEWLGKFNGADHKTNATNLSAMPWALHKKFENIHPFVDGNGRTGRLLWAFDLLRRGQPVKPMLDSFHNPDLIAHKDERWQDARQRYYKALD